MRARASIVFAASIIGIAPLYAERAHAQPGDCPVGSTQKSEGAFQWCEPSVCDSDAQCSAGEICKPIPLCVQVGAIKPTGAAMGDAGGQRLIATQRCGNDKACPDTTTCSEKSRCISRAQADKMGLLAPAAASSASSAGTGEAPKKACGCSVPGSSGGDRSVLWLACALAAVVGARRRFG